MHAACAATTPALLLPPGPHLAPHRTRPPFDSRQAVISLSAANKLSICLAFVGTSVFDNAARASSGWPSTGSCVGHVF